MLNATLVDKRDMKSCGMVAPIVSIEVPAAVEPQLSDFDAPHIPLMDAARDVTGSRQPSEKERRLMFRGVLLVAERAQLTTHILQ